MKQIILKTLLILGVAFNCATSFANSNRVVEALIPPEGFENFFKSYIHQYGNCIHGSMRYYTSATNFVDSNTALDSEKYSDVKIYLLENGQYIAEVELLIPWTEFGEGIKRVISEKQIRGNWFVENDKLILENLGFGKAVQVLEDEKMLKAVEFKIENNYLTEFVNTIYYLRKSESTNVIPELEVSCY